MTLSNMGLSGMDEDSTIKAMLAAEDAIWRPHVTVATVVPRDGRFLLVEEDVRGRLVLNQPAGHLDPDEPLQIAAVRETLEETGWDIELDCLLCVQQWQNAESGRQFVRFTFAGVPIRHHASRALDNGIVRALWLSREEIAAESARLRSPMVLTSVDDWLAGHRLPLDAIRWLPSETASA
jgi:ADP-ribose pyrophosphatase YjhB (NUDIX family)